MRFLLIFIVLVTLSYADETQRIEAIVKDITNLRTDYGKCMSELKAYKKSSKASKVSDCSKYKKELKKHRVLAKKYKKVLDQAIKQNTKLISKLAKYKEFDSILKVSAQDNLPTDVKTLQRELKKYKLLLKIRDKKIKRLQSGNSASFDTAENTIPKLLMKDKYRDEIASKIETFKPSSFRLKQNSEIFDAPNANVVANWKQNRSFTSNQKIGNWIKITGYFINKKWQKAQNEMWIEKDKTIKR